MGREARSLIDAAKRDPAAMDRLLSCVSLPVLLRRSERQVEQRVQHVLERREFNRRWMPVELRLRGWHFVRADWTEQEEEDGMVWRPVLSGKIPSYGCHSDTKETEGHDIFAVPDEYVQDVKGIRGCELIDLDLGDVQRHWAEYEQAFRHGEHEAQKKLHRQDLEMGDWNALWVPNARMSRGRRSYEHTDQAYIDDFAHDNDPLSDHAHWTDHGGGDLFYSDSGDDGHLYLHNPASSMRAWVANDEYTPSSADYSVEKGCQWTHSGRESAMTYRVQSGTSSPACYVTVIQPSFYGVVEIRRFTGTDWVELGKTTFPATNDYHVYRAEVVGSFHRAYMDGEMYVATSNSVITSAGKMGIFSWVRSGLSNPWGSVSYIRALEEDAEPADRTVGGFMHVT